MNGVPVIKGLMEPVRCILAELHDLTGKEVQVVHRPDLKSLARMRMAGEIVDSHTLFYRDEDNPLINHVIANEAAHLLRIYRAPGEERRVAVANGRTLARYQEEIREDIQRLSLIHGLDDLRRFTPQWYEAVVFQLTRMPTDIMIERWLCEQYPDMRKLQTASLLEQHGKAVSILSRSYRRMTPGKIYHVTQVMNYVFFRLLGERLDVHLVEPYERSGYSLEGGDLADWTACHYSEDHEGDVRVIGHWARCLGISEWIEWRRFDEISQEYLH